MSPGASEVLPYLNHCTDVRDFITPGVRMRMLRIHFKGITDSVEEVKTVADRQAFNLAKALNRKTISGVCKKAKNLGVATNGTDADVQELLKALKEYEARLGAFME